MILCDPSITPEETPRLSTQCEKILARLQRGTASNLELSGLALKYTSRISDLRKNGYVVEVISRSHETGEVIYELKSEKGEQNEVENDAVGIGN